MTQLAKSFELRRATGDQVRLPDTKQEWQLRFRDDAAKNFADGLLSRKEWLGISGEEQLYTFINEDASLADVLKNLELAGIPTQEIEVTLTAKSDTK
ncbi:MAG TPA: hypothetical protein VGK22_03760 [Candidatus Angelobacter sp.]|jgi:hypothetical protein